MRLRIIASLILVLLLAACGNDGNNSDSDSKSSNSSNSANNNISETTFSIDFSTEMSLNNIEGRASEGNRIIVGDSATYAMLRFEANATSMTPRLVQFLFANDDLTTGEQVIERVDVATYITQDEESVPIGCDADEDSNLSVNITAVNNNLASGEFSFTVGNCEHYIDPSMAVDINTVTISGTFSDVPFKPAK